MKLSEIKKQLNVFAEITNNRTKIDTSELYNHEYTVDEYVLVPDNKGEVYAVVHCKEIPDKFHFAGKMETDILCMIDSDEEAKIEFKQFGLKLHYEQAKNKNNQGYTKVTMC